MQVLESNEDGLKRELKVMIPAGDLDARLTGKLEEIKNQVRLKGFRPGKVPMSHLRKTFGKQVMSEVIQETVTETSQKALEEKELKPAFQPQIELDGEVEPVMDGKADLTYTMSFEVVPPFDLADFSKIEIERPVVEVEDKDVDDAIERLASQQKSFDPRDEGAAAEDGDLLEIAYVGRIDGEAFEGGSSEDGQLELGSGRFIPGFEEQLVGAKKGDERQVNVTFPEDYPAETVAGKEAVFDVTVKEVQAPKPVEIDDTFAENFGMESLDKLKEAIREQIGRDFSQVSRDRMKREILDALDEGHSFDLPPAMVEQEFGQIWQQFEQEMERQQKTLEEMDESEEDLRAEYRKIAERRVRLGLVLARVGEENGITVTNEELNRALAERARQFPGQEQQLYQFYQQNPQALNELRAPIYEDKVVDYIAELAKITDKPVTREELFADDEDDHDHDHDHSHDHDH